MSFELSLKKRKLILIGFRFFQADSSRLLFKNTTSDYSGFPARTVSALDSLWLKKDVSHYF
ncbi:MAG TPA: hypothetical protein DCM07_00440 [Planctomycetaceae bacterium]|nr:hypothetical protein [Gimesia sp.]HAH43324.1 hypothetical protein [Planctomycetaceae bacterium]HBL42640.1 hypothetical protein [Planctomycetaceae bacterium]